MSTRKPSPLPGDQPLFPDDQYRTLKPIKFRPLDRPVWTANKAHLVALYLKHFLYITKHGTYIDCFAGPQDDHDGNWAAELVLNLEPQWLRRFYLFEQNPKSHQLLQDLAGCYPKRKIVVADRGDTNQILPQVLPARSVRPAEATFCLLDQRTFECSWDLVRHVAELKPDGERKPEQFYFLAQGWLGRSIAATTTPEGVENITRWWGNPDWAILRDLDPQARAELLANRFKEELGYTYAFAWPIYSRPGRGGSVMYHMIHATDHEEAPVLMRRAYDKAVAPTPLVAGQLELDISDLISIGESYLENEEHHR